MDQLALHSAGSHYNNGQYILPVCMLAKNSDVLLAPVHSSIPSQKLSQYFKQEHTATWHNTAIANSPLRSYL